MKRLLTFLFTYILLAACSSNPKSTAELNDTQSRITKADREAALEYRRLQKQDAEEAYKQGVEDTLQDFRGKMDAQTGFVWDPIVVEYVRLPSMIRNGAFIPSHVEPVIVNKGRWIEKNGVSIPESKNQ